MNEKTKLKDYRYIDNLDASKEKPKNKIQMAILICCWTVSPWVIWFILQFKDFFDSQLFGNIMIIVFGFPVVAWSVKRVYTHLINPK